MTVHTRGSHHAAAVDLQGEGPIAWRREIEEAIAACSKFVAIVDRAWLTSYNCLQELAIACSYDKPLVVLVLEQDAWNLLTVSILPR